MRELYRDYSPDPVYDEDMRTLLPILLIMVLSFSGLAATPLTNRTPRQTVDCLITLEIDAQGRTKVISDNTLPHASARYYGQMLQVLAVNGASWLSRIEFRQPVTAVAARTDGGAAWLRADAGAPVALPSDDKDFAPPVKGKSFTIHTSRKPTKIQLIVRGDRIPGYRTSERPGLHLQREQARDVMSRFRQVLSSGRTTGLERYLPAHGILYKSGKTISRLTPAEALSRLSLRSSKSPNMRQSGSRILIDISGPDSTQRWTIEEAAGNWRVTKIEDLNFVLPGANLTRNPQRL